MMSGTMMPPPPPPPPPPYAFIACTCTALPVVSSNDVSPSGEWEGSSHGHCSVVRKTTGNLKQGS